MTTLSQYQHSVSNKLTNCVLERKSLSLELLLFTTRDHICNHVRKERKGVMTGVMKAIWIYVIMTKLRTFLDIIQVSMTPNIIFLCLQQNCGFLIPDGGIYLAFNSCLYLPCGYVVRHGTPHLAAQCNRSGDQKTFIAIRKHSYDQQSLLAIRNHS